MTNATATEDAAAKAAVADPERLVGVISDTHGVLRPAALDALAGCEVIVHAGDVGRAEILETLRTLAPVVAVRGNVDRYGEDELGGLPRSAVVRAGDLYLYVIHNLAELDLDPAGGGFAAVISGHSHRPAVERRNGVLYLNPGAAGPRRFSLPVSVARLWVRGRALRAELVTLEA